MELVERHSTYRVLTVVGLLHNVLGARDLTVETGDAHKAEVVLRAVIEVAGLVVLPNRLAVAWVVRGVNWAIKEVSLGTGFLEISVYRARGLLGVGWIWPLLSDSPAHHLISSGSDECAMYSSSLLSTFGSRLTWGSCYQVMLMLCQYHVRTCY